MVSFTSLPNEILFHCITNHSNQIIRNFALAYCPMRVINQSLKKQIDECWQECLKKVRKDWKINEQFISPKLVVNWIDGTLRVTKESYKDVQKERVLEFHEPVHGFAYQLLDSQMPVLLAESPGENINYNDYYFACNKTIGVHVREGAVTFYQLNGMQLMGLVSGTDKRKVMPHNDLCPLFLENEVCLFKAKTNEQINGPDSFVMEVYDTSSFAKVQKMQLPFYVVSAFASKDCFVFYCRKDNLYVLGATFDGQKFVYSTSLNPPHRSAKLLEIQGKLHFISIKGATLSIQTVEITQEGIHLHLIAIPGIEKFVFHVDLLNVHAHLDKLFVVGYDGNYKTTLFAVDLSLKSMRIITPIDLQWLNHGITAVSSSFGVIKILCPDRNNPYILTLDYVH